MFWLTKSMVSYPFQLLSVQLFGPCAAGELARCSEQLVVATLELLQVRGRGGGGEITKRQLNGTGNGQPAKDQGEVLATTGAVTTVSMPHLLNPAPPPVDCPPIHSFPPEPALLPPWCCHIPSQHAPFSSPFPCPAATPLPQAHLDANARPLQELLEAARLPLPARTAAALSALSSLAPSLPPLADAVARLSRCLALRMQLGRAAEVAAARAVGFLPYALQEMAAPVAAGEGLGGLGAAGGARRWSALLRLPEGGTGPDVGLPDRDDPLLTAALTGVWGAVWGVGLTCRKQAQATLSGQRMGS